MLEIENPYCPRCGNVAAGIAQGPSDDGIVGYAEVEWDEMGSGTGIGGMSYHPSLCDYSGNTELFWDYDDVVIDGKILLWCSACVEGFTSSYERV